MEINQGWINYPDERKTEKERYNSCNILLVRDKTESRRANLVRRFSI